MSTLYTAKVAVEGGRNGIARSADGRLETRLAFPVALGGTGEGTNPEQLFGAGYAACFASTLEVVAKADGLKLPQVSVDAEVDIVQTDGDMDLAVRLSVRAQGVAKATLESLIAKAENACPYARAVRHNVKTIIAVLT
ncbi:MAG: Ohr family peroxiredoxin [Clostridia bacterium]|nr:Ohr family peroxiredoxin [Deltaproteobacteria bacterium]